MHFSESLLTNILNKKVYQIEFPSDCIFYPEHMCFDVFNNQYLNELEIKFSEYKDDVEPSYNKIIIEKHSHGLRDGVANNGTGKFFMNHRNSENVSFYGYIINGVNTGHVIFLKFSNDFNILIDAYMPFAATFHFIQADIAERLKDPMLFKITKE